MREILDFDANFAAYSEKWMQMNRAKFSNIDQMEDAMPEVYMRWLNSPAAFLNGDTPAMYFTKYSDARELVSWLLEYEDANVNVPDPLMERIVDLGEISVAPLIDLARDEYGNTQTRVMALNLLKEIDAGARPMDTCLGIIDKRDEEDEVADVAAELLLSIGEACAKPILDRLDDVNDAARETYLDILCNYPGDERIFAALIRAFEEHTEKCALYASLLGKLGDARALNALREALDRPDINYLDYLEVKNAVEMLGGAVEGEREFAGDPYYETLKGV